jgi:D-alanine-D-alanine ligase
MGLRVVLLDNLDVNAPAVEGAPPDLWSELDSVSTFEAIAQALREGGHTVIPMEGTLANLARLPRYRPDIVFNLCEGHFGESREAQVPAILEMLRIPYVGAKPLAHAVGLDKPMCKRVLLGCGLPTPPFQEFRRPDEPLRPELAGEFPLFVKPAREGTGMGISHQSIVQDEQSLRARVEWLIRTYRQPALVEKFIDGRDLTVGMIGNDEDLHVFPIMEVDLSPLPEDQRLLYGGVVKKKLYRVPRYLIPAPLAEETAAEVKRLAVAAYRAIGGLDMSRVDFRLDRQGKPWILEINTIPGLMPVDSDLVMVAEADGISHTELINRILEAACRRYGLTAARQPRRQAPRPSPKRKEPLVLSPSAAEGA